MTIGVIGRKQGMTRIFNESGVSEPVTVVLVEPNRITQVKTLERDGYDAIQVTTGHRKQAKVNKPEAGHLAKAGVEAGRGLWEFRLIPGKETGDEQYALGKEYGVNIFALKQKVDVIGTSRGKGFAGVIKRYNFAMQDATHGNSLSHRAPGSIGQNQTPGRVFKGKKMAGRMGNHRCTVQNLEVLKIDAERNLLLIRGAIPGAPGGDVIINPACNDKQQGN